MSVSRNYLNLSFIQYFFAAVVFIIVSSAAGAQQAKLPTEEVVIKTKDGQEFSFISEMALTPDQQATGMMFRTEMGPNEGMLFVFDEVRRASFWMRNCVIPLDMLFIRPNGRIANIIENAEPGTDTARRSNGRVLGVFEIPGGRAAELGIKAGDLLVHPAYGG